MDPVAPALIQKKYLIIAAAVLVVLFIFFAIASSTTKKQSAILPTLVPTAEPRYVPSYVPPASFKYATLDSLNFLPKRINGMLLDQKKLQDDVRRAYPSLSNNEIVDIINTTVFTWLALNNFYDTHDQSKVSDIYKKDITNFTTINRETKQLKDTYTPDVTKISGLYLRVRFAGIVPTNVKKLKKTQSELRSLAQQLIEKYKTDLEKASNKENVLTTFNNNTTVLLLNNRETSKSFTDSSLFPPLIADTNYYAMIQALPVGKVSDMQTVSARLNGKTIPEEYAYIVFYISNKKGTNLPIETLVNDYVAHATLE